MPRTSTASNIDPQWTPLNRLPRGPDTSPKPCLEASREFGVAPPSRHPGRPCLVIIISVSSSFSGSMQRSTETWEERRLATSVEMVPKPQTGTQAFGIPPAARLPDLAGRMVARRGWRGLSACLLARLRIFHFAPRPRGPRPRRRQGRPPQRNLHRGRPVPRPYHPARRGSTDRPALYYSRSRRTEAGQGRGDAAVRGSRCVSVTPDKTRRTYRRPDRTCDILRSRDETGARVS